MSIHKKIMFCLSLLLLVALSAVFLLPQERDRNAYAALRVGAGDDVSGFLLERVLAQEAVAAVRKDAELEAYAFQDC